MWLDEFPDPPKGFHEWAAPFASADAALEACTRADWLIWLAYRSAKTDEARKNAIASAAAHIEPLFDRRGWRMLTPRIGLRPIEVANAWVQGGLGDLTAFAVKGRRTILITLLGGLFSLVIYYPWILPLHLVHSPILDNLLKQISAGLLTFLVMIPIVFILVFADLFRQRRQLRRVDGERALEIVLGALRRKKNADCDELRRILKS